MGQKTGISTDMVKDPHSQSTDQGDDTLDALGLEGVEAQSASVDASTAISSDYDEWKKPFYLRYKLATGVGIAASVAWLWLTNSYIGEYIGWDVLFELLPHELGGLAAGVFTPIALLWMVIALFERGHSLRGETSHLRWQIRQLTYPTDRSESRVKEISDSLRRQARDLSKASDDAYQRAEAITAQVRERTLELARVSQDADLRARAVAEALSRETDELRIVSEKAETRASDVSDILHRRGHDITTATDRASTRAEDLVDVLERRIQELTDVADAGSRHAYDVADTFHQRTEDLSRISAETAARAESVGETDRKSVV